ncbi:MAG: hypothetical protein N3A63_05605 [Bacteroidetes bacterium]|nr:hypothetical protein [Bacteroidota bacterium]
MKQKVVISLLFVIVGSIWISAQHRTIDQNTTTPTYRTNAPARSVDFLERQHLLIEWSKWKGVQQIESHQSTENGSHRASISPTNTAWSTNQFPLRIFLGIVVLLGVVNGVGLWLLFFRKKNPSVPAEKNEITPQAKAFELLDQPLRHEREDEEKSNQMAEIHLQEVQEDGMRSSFDREMDEKEVESTLRQMKYQHKAETVKQVAQKRMSKTQLSKTAKKLGTGIGEIELATRLVHLQKKGANR